VVFIGKASIRLLHDMGVVDWENIDDPKLLDDAVNLFLVQHLSKFKP
jgi:hypothetical protein